MGLLTSVASSPVAALTQILKVKKSACPKDCHAIAASSKSSGTLRLASNTDVLTSKLQILKSLNALVSASTRVFATTVSATAKTAFLALTVSTRRRS